MNDYIFGKLAADRAQTLRAEAAAHRLARSFSARHRQRRTDRRVRYRHLPSMNPAGRLRKA